MMANETTALSRRGFLSASGLTRAGAAASEGLARLMAAISQAGSWVATHCAWACAKQ